MPLPTVAIIGVNGKLGRPTIEAMTTLFQDEYKFPIHALSRERFESTELIQYHQVSFDDQASVELALQGCDTVVDLSGNGTDAKLLIDAAVKVGVTIFFTSDYRVDYIEGEQDELYLQKEFNYEYAMSQDFDKVVQIIPGLYTEWVVSNLYFVGIHGDSYARLDDGQHRVSMTSIDNVAKAVASLAYRQSWQLPDLIRIQGETLTCDEIAKIYSRITRTRLRRDKEPKIVVEEGHRLNPLRTWLLHPSQPLDMLYRTQNEVVNPDVFQWSGFKQIAEKLLLS